MTRSAQPATDSLLKHGVLMIALGTGVCALGSIMAKPAQAPIGYFAAAALIGAGLLIALASFGIRYKGAIPPRAISAYIATGLLMVCYSGFLVMYRGWLETPVLGLMAGLLGLLWAAWFVTLAFTFPPTSAPAVGLCALAAANSSFGFILATRAGLNRLTAVIAAGCYIICLGIQVYLAAVMLHRGVMRERVLERR